MSVFIKEPQTPPAQACLIWMHGLGADAADMMGLADQLGGSEALRHVFINAPLRPVTLNAGMIMPAWYDIVGTNLVDRIDRQGIEQSAVLIRKVMDEQLSSGFAFEQIFLAGFSQGGAMALHVALHTPERLAGLVALSSYLPLAADSKPKMDKNTPIFMGYGQYDPLVLPQWTELSKDWLLAREYKKISYNSYPMEHAICSTEIRDLSFWIGQQVKEIAL